MIKDVHMASTLSSHVLEEIKQRITDLPAGQIVVSSIGVKNYLMWAGGNWDEKYDLPMHNFFAHAKNDVELLIADLEEMKQKVYDLEESNESLKKRLIVATDELNYIKNNLEDDGR